MVEPIYRRRKRVTPPPRCWVRSLDRSCELGRHHRGRDTAFGGIKLWNRIICYSIICMPCTVPCCSGCLGLRPLPSSTAAILTSHDLTRVRFLGHTHTRSGASATSEGRYV